MNYVLLGIQGSGKATCRNFLSEKYGFYTYDSGATLRNIANGVDSFALFIRQKIDQGDFVDDILIINLFESFLISAVPNNKNIIIDGLPRNIHQAHLFQNLMHKYKKQFKIIYLHLSKKIAIQRILERFKIEGRKDDQKDIIIKRIDMFFKYTIPAIEYLSNIADVIDIDTNKTKEEVFKDLENKIVNEKS